MDISLESWNTQDKIHISNGVPEEGGSGPMFWKLSVQQCRGIPEEESGKGWRGEQAEGRGLRGLLGGGIQERGNHLKCK